MGFGLRVMREPTWKVFQRSLEARMEVMLTLEGRQELRVTRIGMVVGQDQSLPVVKDFLVG